MSPARRLVPACGVALALAGCAAAAPPVAPDPPAGTLTHYEESLRLPDGTTLTSGQSAAAVGPDLSVQLEVEEVYPPHDGALDVVGNHAAVASETAIDTPQGPGQVVQVTRTPPAAAPATETARTEYWVYVLRDDPQRAGAKTAYAIVATAAAPSEGAETHLRALLGGWALPPPG